MQTTLLDLERATCSRTEAIEHRQSRREVEQGENCPRAASSKGPHNTLCRKVWGPHKVNQQYISKVNFKTLKMFCSFRSQGASAASLPGASEFSRWPCT